MKHLFLILLATLPCHAALHMVPIISGSSYYGVYATNQYMGTTYAGTTGNQAEPANTAAFYQPNNSS